MLFRLSLFYYYYFVIQFILEMFEVEQLPNELFLGRTANRDSTSNALESNSVAAASQGAAGTHLSMRTLQTAALNKHVEQPFADDVRNRSHASLYSLNKGGAHKVKAAPSEHPISITLNHHTDHTKKEVKLDRFPSTLALKPDVQYVYSRPVLSLSSGASGHATVQSSSRAHDTDLLEPFFKLPPTSKFMKAQPAKANRLAAPRPFKVEEPFFISSGETYSQEQFLLPVTHSLPVANEPAITDLNCLDSVNAAEDTLRPEDNQLQQTPISRTYEETALFFMRRAKEFEQQYEEGLKKQITAAQFEPKPGNIFIVTGPLKGNTGTLAEEDKIDPDYLAYFSSESSNAPNNSNDPVAMEERKLSEGEQLAKTKLFRNDLKIKNGEKSYQNTRHDDIHEWVRNEFQKSDAALRQKETEAAVRIQCTLRAFSQKKQFQVLKNATIKLQAHWRGIMAREHYRLMIEQRRAELEEERVISQVFERQQQRNKAALLLQQAMKNFLLRKRLATFRTVVQTEWFRHLKRQALTKRRLALVEQADSLKCVGDVNSLQAVLSTISKIERQLADVGLPPFNFTASTDTSVSNTSLALHSATTGFASILTSPSTTVADIYPAKASIVTPRRPGRGRSSPNITTTSVSTTGAPVVLAIPCHSRSAGKKYPSFWQLPSYFVQYLNVFLIQSKYFYCIYLITFIEDSAVEAVVQV